jgi:hypothetical protein
MIVGVHDKQKRLATQVWVATLGLRISVLINVR